MILKKSTLFLAALALIVSCSKSEKKTVGQPVAGAAAPVKPLQAKPAETPREFTPTKYSNAKWNNGIMRGEANQVLITLRPKIPTPIRAGTKLEFAAAGEATVLGVWRIDYPAYANLFVRVDRTLDPVGDGHPHRIRVRSIAVIPSAYSKTGVWENGIHLKNAGVFVFSLSPQEDCPLRIGDRLRFAGAGEATVRAVNALAGSGSRSVLVTVDKPLDPSTDGAPNPVQVIVKESTGR